MRQENVDRFVAIKKMIDQFRSANNWRAIANLVAAFSIFFLSIVTLCWAMQSSIDQRSSILFVAGCYLLAGLSIAKIFTIQHDCGHYSYFTSPKANRALGRICAIVTFIPFTAWNEEHLEHHASFGNLEMQTHGDVRLLTIVEFRNSPPWRRAGYRLFRSMSFLLLIAPLLYLILRQRVPRKLRASRVWSCILHTGGILLVYGILYFLIGDRLLLLIIPPLYIAGVMAVIIFVVEHQFENAEWVKTKNWNFFEASLSSSSYLALPPILEWFTGNIGYHHIHHLNPKIPSYRLRECFVAVGEMLPCKRITLSNIPRSLVLSLWSEEAKKIVTFREARLLRC